MLDGAPRAIPRVGDPLIFSPHDYQESTIARMVRDPRLGLFLDPGLGKTSISLEAFRRLRAEFEVSRALVVAPLRTCYSVWPREQAKWDQFDDVRVQIIHGPTKDFETLHGGADVFVTNPETLEWLKDQHWKHRPEMLVVDESTKFKRKSTQRHAWLRKLIKKGGFDRRYILTATPAPRNVEDLHGQLHILDDGARLSDAVGTFRERFMVPVPNGNYWTWVPRKGAVGEVGRLIRDVCINLRASDHLSLPPLVEVDVPVILPERAREIYDRLRKKAVLIYGDRRKIADNRGVVCNMLRQLASGAIYADDGERFDVIHTAKAEALVDLVEQLGGRPLLVAYNFKHEVRAIREALRQDVPCIGGGTPSKLAAQHELDWNAGRLPLLLVQPQSGAHGLNLQDGGGHLCWYSPPFDAELYWQFNGRLHRQGQKADRVMVHRLVGLDTVDERIVRVLWNRAASQAELFAAIDEEVDATPSENFAEADHDPLEEIFG
jgi:SNF2 family DNA or RNA helicase